MPSAFPAAAGSLMCAALAMPALAQERPDEDTRAIEQRTQRIREATAPSVVSVRVTKHGWKLPRLVFPGVTIAATGCPEQRVDGAGFVVASRGLVVTTCEIVCDAAAIELLFHDGTRRDATLVGVDRPFCLAVLRTSTPDSAVPLPDSQRVEASPSVAGWLFAPPSERSPSPDVQMTLVRPAPEQGAAYDRPLYAPVSIARGAAGGPLVGADGFLLGMAVGTLVARDEQCAAGAAAPYPRATLFVRGDDIAEAARQIAANGRVFRGMLGTLTEGDSNRIGAVFPGSPAQAAGLAEGDTIVGVGTMSVGSYADLTRALLRRHPGDRVKIAVRRGDAQLARCVQLAPFEVKPAPKEPPVAGAVIEMSADPACDATFTFTDVLPGSPAAKSGVVAGDRIVSVDGRSALRFILRHRAGAATAPPSKIVVQRGEATVELPFAGE
jgi:S1-C subfamily serine protease